MQGALYLSALKAAAASGFGVVCAVNLCHNAVFILYKIGAGYEICLQAHCLPRSQTEELLHGFFHEVLSFDIKLSGEGCQTFAQFWCFGVVFQLHHFHLILRIISDN